MNAQSIFVGRERELHMIDRMVADPERKSYVFPIIGEGGVGKTWLLQAVRSRYEEDPGVVVVPIDYAESRTQSLPALSIYVLRQFSNHVPEEQQAEFLRRMSDWEHFAESEVTPYQVQEMEDAAYDFGLSLISKVAEQKRILILSDTVETEETVEQSDRINLLAARFPNTVIVLAGRPTAFTQHIYSRLPLNYRKWKIRKVHRLKPFSKREAKSYLERTLSAEIASDLRDKIILLTGGNPVLLAITCEWLKRHISLPEDVDLPLKTLRELDSTDLARLQQAFEFALIDKIRTLRYPIDWATLYLAYLNRRYDPSILQLALDIDDEAQLNSIIEELKTLVFVRQSMTGGGILLHDEAERLVREHAWPVVDPDCRLRRSLAQKVIDQYYLPKIDSLTKTVQEILARRVEQRVAAPEQDSPSIPDEQWLKRELQMECLDYHFRVSEEAGWKYLDQLIDEALVYRYSPVQMDVIVQAVNIIAPRVVDSTRFRIRVAENLLMRRDLVRATNLARLSLEAPEVSPSDAATAHIILGECATDPLEKTGHFEDALEQARLMQDRRLEAIVLNNLGQAYRRQGHWSRAEELYREALRLWDEDQDRNQYAMTLNNLAYVYLLRGSLSRADNWAERALLIRKEAGNIYGLGFSYSTKGQIAREMGDYAKALHYHRMAVDLFERIGDVENADLMRVNVASAERRAHNFDVARQLLLPALGHRHLEIRVRALHEAATIDLEEGRALTAQGVPITDVMSKYGSAEKNARQTLELAVASGNNYLIANVLLDLSLLALLKDGHADKEHMKALQEILQSHDYPLIRGRFIELMGDLDHLSGNIVSAFERYLESCDILASYSPASFRQTFERVRDKYLDASPDVQTQIRHMIQTKFSALAPSSPLVALQELCIGDPLDF